MFAAHSRLHLPPATIDLDVGVGARFRFAVVRHDGTVWDTRFVPPNRGDDDHAVLYLVLEGEVRWIEPVELRVEAGGGFVTPNGVYEGVRGQRVGRLRASGSPFLGFELHLAWRELPRLLSSPQRIEVMPATLSAARALAGVHDPSTEPMSLAALPAERHRLVAELFDALHADGSLRGELSRSMSPPGGIEERLWSAFLPYIEGAILGPGLDEVSERARLSLRQLDRVIGHFLRRFSLPWPGWRGLTRNYRLKAAILLLSCPSLRLADIAERCGYSSGEALTHALAAEGLPSPGELRRLILAG